MTTLAASGDGSESPRILIAHPDGLLRQVLAEEVEDLGYAAQCAATGRAAIATLERDPLDLVFVDACIAAPGLRGVLVAGSVVRPEARFVVLLPFAGGIEVEKTIKLPPFAYLRMPVAVDDLRLTIELGLGAPARRGHSVAEGTVSSGTPSAGSTG